MSEPLFRVLLKAPDLYCAHPPKVRHPNKTTLLELAYPRGAEAQGTIEVTRWRAGIHGTLKLHQRCE